MAYLKIYSKFDGKLKEEKSYKEGKLNGTSKTFFTDGKIESEKTTGWARRMENICRMIMTELCGWTIIIRMVNK